MSNEQQNVLTFEKVQQLMAAFTRLNEIGGGTIIDPRSEAEVVGLKKFIADTMVEHANEFVGCWIAVRQEYEPMIQTIERIANRIFSVRQAARGVVANESK